MMHPAFYYHLFFRIARPMIQRRIGRVEEQVTTWHGLGSFPHPMGGKAFFFHEGEIGHIHWNGNLDIVLGRELTSKLLTLDRLQRHQFLPDRAITFPMLKDEDVSVAISLLRFSYVLRLRNAYDDMLIMENYIDQETVKLPGDLKKILAYPLK
jgi:hypothetical protein